MLLDATTKTIEITVDAVATTTESPFVVEYGDNTTTGLAPASSDGVTNGTTVVTMLAAPASSTQRKVFEITVYNADSVPHTYTIKYNDNATKRTVFMGAVQAGQTLTYEKSNGWTIGATGVLTPSFAGFIMMPSGRLTLTSGTPVLTSDVVSATTVYYTPYNGSYVPIYDGTSTWTTYQFNELSQATTDTTKSPAACAANKNYDIFVWNDAGTLRATRGAAWSSDTARGAGNLLTLQNGIYVNTSTITNGPAAAKGTYVGTIRTDGSSQVNMMFFPAAASGGAANKMHVWNMYNRILTSSINRDSTATWTYSIATTRAKNGNANNGTSLVLGLSEDLVEALHTMNSDNSAGNGNYIAIGLDSTSATVAGSHAQWGAITSGKFEGHTAVYSAYPGLGFHTIYPLEGVGNATGTTTWLNNGTPDSSTGYLSPFFVKARM